MDARDEVGLDEADGMGFGGDAEGVPDDGDRPQPDGD